jgi:Transposase DDE domain group 1
MPTECSAELFEFAPVERRTVVAGFDGGAITSDAGALLLRATDGAIRLIDRFAACFVDGRKGDLIEHLPATLVGQRVLGIALGYEDVNDHDELRHDPIMAVLAGKLRARRKNCAPVAGKSTLNRLELSRETATRYHKIGHDSAAIGSLFVTLFLEAHETAPEEPVNRRAGAPRVRLSSRAIMSSAPIARLRRAFLASPKMKSTPLASHHAISASRAKPESARKMIRTSGQRPRICATMRAISSTAPADASMLARRSWAAKR